MQTKGQSRTNLNLSVHYDQQNSEPEFILANRAVLYHNIASLLY